MHDCCFLSKPWVNMYHFIFTRYTSPNDGGNDIIDDPKPGVQQAIEKLQEVVVQLNAAIKGDEIINFVSGDEESGSGSGSGSGGESGDGNEIPENTDKPMTDSENEIDEEDENENAFAGGVNKPSAGSNHSSASRQRVGVWLLISAIGVFLATLIA